MLLLTSGRVADLSTHRAKFHALNQHGPAIDAEHRALYGLVDVIIRHRDDNGTPRAGRTEYDYVYSGYTLGNIHRADNWSDTEKAELLSWALKTTQKLHIETARRRLVDNQTALSVKQSSAPQNLYSSLVKRLKALPMQAATAGQWLATIKNMQQSGLRQEEISWSGVQAYLTQHIKQSNNDMLTKQQILASIDFNPIALTLSTEQISGTDGGLCFREVAQRLPHQAVYRAALKLDDTCLCILRYVDETFNYRVGVLKTLNHDHPMALNKYWFALDPYGRAITNNKQSLYYSDSESAKAAADNHARDYLGLRSGVKFNSRFDYLSLYGGQHYREWIVSLSDYQRIFFGAHHFDHNVLLHIRTTTRHDVEGNKLLFIEELQSDWHQNGQLNGYDNSYWGKVANAPFKKEWPALGMKLMLIHASQNGFDGIAWAEGKIQETRYNKNLCAIKRRYDVDMPKALNRLGRSFNCCIETTEINTRDPWLNLVKSKNKWRVSDGYGKFKTRDKYHNREQAMTVLHRHCKAIELPVSMYLINDALREHIVEKGLPLFGETVCG